MRRFPAPWTVEAIDAGFKVVDATRESIARAINEERGRTNPALRLVSLWTESMTTTVPRATPCLARGVRDAIAFSNAVSTHMQIALSFSRGTTMGNLLNKVVGG